MNLPNLLTLSRLLLIAIMMALLSSQIPYAHSMALIVFAIAGITDFLDGYLARKHHQITAFGRLMDPLTDKVMVCAAFVCFVEIQVQAKIPGAGMPPVNAPLVPAWIVVVIVAREFLVTGLRLLAAGRGNILSAGKWGKHKTVWQIVAIVVILLGLAIRDDILRGADPSFMAKYNYAFWYISNAVALAVAVITMASGILYFVQHRELISEGHH